MDDLSFRLGDRCRYSANSFDDMAKTKIETLLARIHDNFDRDAIDLNAQLVAMGLEPTVSKQSLDDPDAVGDLPTLDSGTCKSITPMLSRRFEYCGRWKRFTETWLSISQMETVTRNRKFKRNFKIQKEDWEDSAPGLIPPNRLTVFSVASHDDGEYTFLVWPETGNREPELWRYHGHSETRFKNLQVFLEWVAGS